MLLIIPIQIPIITPFRLILFINKVVLLIYSVIITSNETHHNRPEPQLTKIINIMFIYVLIRVKTCKGELNMKKGATIGLVLLVVGIVIWIAYGLYLGFEELMKALDIVTGLVGLLIIVGLIILVVSIVIEQRIDTKKMKEEIKEEDLEP